MAIDIIENVIFSQFVSLEEGEEDFLYNIPDVTVTISQVFFQGIHEW